MPFVVPLKVVRVTETVPVPEGDKAVQVVVEEQETDGAGFVDPKSTVVPPDAVEKPVPSSVTLVPPAVGPEVGEMEVRVGADM